MKQLAYGAGCCIMGQKSIAITGGTGLIGREAIRFFSEKGYALRILSRKERPSDATNVQYFKWNPEQGEIPIAAIEGVHAIIHLAGAPIAQRWSAEYKQTIIDSRVKSARVILEALKGLPEAARPECIVSASAVGWYASSFEKQSEHAGRAEGFIGDVTEAWESALDGFRAIGMRTVSLRIGLVLAHEGGFLGRLKPAIQSGPRISHWQRKALAIMDTHCRCCAHARLGHRTEGLCRCIQRHFSSSGDESRNVAMDCSRHVTAFLGSKCTGVRASTRLW